MPKVIIAEKPSLAKNIVLAIGSKSFKKGEGYYESDDYIVVPAFGHLFTLLDIEEYDSGYVPDGKSHWSIDELPFVPNPFRFTLKKDVKTKKVDAGVKKQFETIKKLIHRNDVTGIINAGDSDREGEIIVRIILDNAGNTKPVYRLWMPDQTPETINQELRNMENDSKYDNLANEGMSRTYIDWLYGINLTRYASVKSSTLLRVGRVIAPIVKAIYDRDMEIKNFVPEKYYGIVSKEITNGEEIELVSKNKFKNDELAKAEKMCRDYNSVDAIVRSAKTDRKEVKPGKLYSLSKLEGVLGKKFKMSINDTLATVQTLYEAGYVTYPRTNTEYMATAEKDKVKGIIKALTGAGFPVAFKDSKTIFDDSKIESHSALTPTTKIPDLSKLSERERNVYETIRNRFVAVFCSEPCLVDRSTIKIDVGDYETFELKGDIMVQKGWTAYDYYEKKDKTLPALSEGDVVNTKFKPVEKETTPPKHYTTETLNSYLKNPFKEESAEENDDEEYKAMLNGVELGTEATRPGIITNAINAKYISLKNDTYYIMDDGIYYIETLEKLQIDMSKNKSVELSVVLKDVYKGTKTIDESIQLTKKEIERILEHKNDITIDAMTSKHLGNCPVCGKPLKKQSWGVGCTGYKEGCKFSINGVVAGKKLTESNLKQLLEKGETNTIKGFKGKSGNKFDAKLKLVKNESGEGPAYKLTFAFESEETREKNKISAKCPCCGGEIKDDKWSWKCTECDFAMNYKIAGKTMTVKDLEAIVFEGKTTIIKGFISKAGKKFDARLVLDTENKKVNFSFDK